ncbi:MAG: nucleotide exchange factor GrpE [Anaerolineae bacterium]|nr:nucleotide exchange factor GrpE [Anaerolineae bacterium]MDW8070395.1 nucleotide exchange factor GrpE [Anaerolineae bacterium]
MFVFEQGNPVFYSLERSPARRIPVRVVDDNHEETGSPAVAETDSDTTKPSEPVDWKDLALRLQAEMNNFRKRQEQRADEATAREKERLLRLFLPIVDDLRRALAAEPAGLSGGAPDALREGVQLTYRELRRLLESEGVQEIEALGQPFTPELHAAVATVVDPVRSGLVVEVLEPGYMLNGRLLRPARVVVAA